jgi:integrase
VDKDRREILVEPETEKAGRGRVIPMTPFLAAEMERLREVRKGLRPVIDGSDRVFTLEDGSALTKALLRTGFEEAVTRCRGIPLDKRRKVTLHTLRHTCASLMVGAGVPLFDVAKFLGHSTLAVTMRYAHAAPEAGRSSVDRLAAVLAGPGAQVPARVATLA